MHKLVPATLALAMGLPIGAVADTPADVAALRQEMDAMRAAYEARLQSLEQRLRRAEAALATPAVPTAAVAASAPAAPVVAESPTGPPGGVAGTAPALAPAAVAAAGATGGASAFNPALSLILSGLYTHTSLDPVNYALTGFQLPAGGEFGPGTRGFSLAESELGFAASIDPWFRGAANISIHSDNTISVEEAYVQTTSLGNGLSLKAGRFFSNIGYLNPQHSHTWDFVDNPLAYQAFLGTQYGDDGVQMSWLAPIDQYLELGAEAGRGRSFPGTDTGRNGPGMVALTAHTGGDIGESHSWRAGVSVLNAKATDQLLVASNAAGDPVSDSFNGSTRVWIADAVWKWAPEGNATRTSFKLQGEYLQSTRQRQPGLRRRQRRQRRQLSRCPVGLVPAGDLQVPSPTGASACAPSNSIPGRPTMASTPARSRPAATGRARPASCSTSARASSRAFACSSPTTGRAKG